MSTSNYLDIERRARHLQSEEVARLLPSLRAQFGERFIGSGRQCLAP